MREVLLAIGVYVNSALYLSGVFVAGLTLHNQAAWKGALATAGVCYFASFLQLTNPQARGLHIVVVTASILLGAASGLVLVP